MKKILGIILGTILMLSLARISFAASTQVDSLIEKLVDKGILSRAEGIKLKGEIASDEKLLREEGLKQSLPKWVQDIKLKGDFRLRYQYERRDASTEARTRGRIRYRLGVESKVNDTVKVGAGLASGGSDPRSTNQTLENSFEHPDIRLDYAYGQWAPAEWFNIIGGKFERKDYLWAPTDFIWDSDINPNGGSAHWEHKINDNFTPFANTGVWIIDEVNSGLTDKADPFMTYLQAGNKWKGGSLDATIAAIVYKFNGVKGRTLDSTAGTNTLTGGVLRSDYDSVGVAADFGITEPFGLEYLERVGIFGEFINNVDDIDDDTGWSAGIAFGNKKVVNRGQWQAKYIYVNLGRDAFPDAFPDSDRIGGSTDIKSHEAILEFGLSKNVTLAIDYYYTRRIEAAANPEKLVQADLNFKF